jgi:hypothetical protein
MQTIAEKPETAGRGVPKVPQRPLQAKIDEPLLDRVKILAARLRCAPRDIVTAALEGYLPEAERQAEQPR